MMKAFPATFETKDVTIMNGGMDLRDYFAAKAMQGIVSQTTREYVHEDNFHLALINPELVAREAYAIADAMMKAREVK